jgi:hypothetical protein
LSLTRLNKLHTAKLKTKLRPKVQTTSTYRGPSRVQLKEKTGEFTQIVKEERKRKERHPNEALRTKNNNSRRIVVATMIHGKHQHRAFGLATFAIALFGALLATPLLKGQDAACTFLAHDLKAKELRTWGLSLQTPSMLASLRDLMNNHPVRNETEVPVCTIQKPSKFDCNRSTEDYHRSDQKKLYGRYASIRKQLDHNYHAYYSRSRQTFQDSIIDSMLEKTWIEDKYGQNCSQPTRPWIVFTAGVMGAG